jgi:trimethylamine---corrinoid protein Co-methyltransferase
MKVPRLTMLSIKDRGKFFSAALDVLAQTGISVLEESIIKTLSDAGARIEGTRAYIPTKLVEQALKTAPKEIQIYNRDGEPAMRLTGFNNYYGNGTDCPNILDPFTGKRRPFLKKDIEQAGILCDAISNYSFVMPTGVASDMPPAIADIHNFHAMLTNTAKPIIFTAYTPENHQDIYRIAAIAAGGEKALQDKPFIISYPQPISPLTFTKEV